MKTNAENREYGSTACVVCGMSDARALFDVRLVGGVCTMLCGSHALMHRRSRVQARTVRELRDALRDRRHRSDRRAASGDELGAKLASAFAGGERRVRDRRA
jgi:hypothetical protein